MNKLSKELKAKLDGLFSEATLRSKIASNLAHPDFDEISQADRESFDYIRQTIESVLSANFKNDVRYAVPDAKFSDELRQVLAFRPFSTFEAWHVAPDITEEALMAAEADIRAGKFAALEGLRDPKRKVDFEMPLAGDRLGEYLMFLHNLQYLLVVLAHQAKRYSSFDAARLFLRAASLVNRRSKMIPPNLKAEDIDNVVDWIDEGIDELQIAADYDRLESWDVFCPREGKRFAQVLKERESQS